MKSRLFNFLFALWSLLTVLSVQGQTPGVGLPEGYRDLLNETYTTVNGWEGKADIYYNPTNKKPTPIVVMIHGGGWSKGSRANMGPMFFLKQGFAVMNIDYRLVDVAPAPAAIPAPGAGEALRAPTCLRSKCAILSAASLGLVQ